MSVYQKALEQTIKEIGVIQKSLHEFYGYDVINDIAGVRIVCPLKSDINTIVNILNQVPTMKVIKEKDYITTPKESGYSGYHLIVEILVEIENRKLPVKVEIQLRTMAMDFWATNEHKVKYKTNKKLSGLDSKKMILYAKILNFIDTKMTNLCQKQRNKI